MPFAEQPAAVAGAAEHLRERHLVRPHERPARERVNRLRAIVVPPGEQGRPRRGTDGADVKVCALDALMRKPVNVRIINAVQTSCAALIIGYMLFITFFDAQDWRPWKRSPKMPERRFTVPSGPTQIQ